MDLQWAKECKWADPKDLEIAKRNFPHFVRTKEEYWQPEVNADMNEWFQERGLTIVYDVGDHGDYIYWERSAFLFAVEKEAILFKLRFG